MPHLTEDCKPPVATGARKILPRRLDLYIGLADVREDQRHLGYEARVLYQILIEEAFNDDGLCRLHGRVLIALAGFGSIRPLKRCLAELEAAALALALEDGTIWVPRAQNLYRRRMAAIRYNRNR